MCFILKLGWRICKNIALYPSSMIAENISHDTLINEEEVEYYTNQGYKINKITYEVNGIDENNYYATHDP